jgi:cytochrome c biogenesis protein
MRTLGFFDIFHSVWYLALLAALVLNALVCTIQRLPRLWSSVTQPPKIVRPDPFYQGFAQQAEWPVPALEQGVASAQAWLRRRHYRVHVQTPAPAAQAYIFAERGRWSQFGSIVSHAAAILLVAAVAARPTLLWLESGVALLPGQDHAVERTVPFTVRAGELTVERHPGGQPRQYRVPLALVLDGAPVLTQTVGINHPFNYHQVAFHLQGYGPGARLETPGGVFHVALSGSHAKELALPEVGFRLRLAQGPEGDAFFVEVLSTDGTLLGSGLVHDGQEVEVRGLPISFNVSRYTTWQVSHDPTFIPAVAAALLLLLGVIVSLWVPYRRLWVRVDGDRAQMVGTGDFARGVGRSFDSLASELASRSSAFPGASDPKPQVDPRDRHEVSDA